MTWEDVPSILTNQMAQAMWWHSASWGDKAPVNNRSLQAGIKRAEPCESNTGNMFILSSSLFDGKVCFWEYLQNRFTNKTWRMITPHSSEPKTLNKFGNTGRNWVCSGSPISLDLALLHLTKLQGMSITVWRWVLNGTWSTEDAMESPSLWPHQWM